MDRAARREHYQHEQQGQKEAVAHKEQYKKSRDAAENGDQQREEP